MPILKRIPCLIPALTFILLILQTGCGSSDAEMEFYLKMDGNTVATKRLLKKANENVLKDITYETEREYGYKPMLSVALEANRIAEDFDKYIEKIRNDLLKEAGGIVSPDDPDKTKAVRPADYQNKKIATRYFLSGEHPKGLEIKNKILDTRRQLIDLIDTIRQVVPIDVALIKQEEIDILKQDISLKVDDAIWKAYQSNSWEHFTFNQVPLAKIFIILSALQNDARKSEFMIVNYMAGKIGNKIDGFDIYEPVSSPEAGYVLVGKKFKTDIFLASNGDIRCDDIVIKVNDSSIPVKEGKGHYEVLTKSVGEKAYHVEIIVFNSLTNRSQSYSKTFKYQVGRCSE